MVADNLVVKLRLDPLWLFALRIACAIRCAPAVRWLAKHPLVKVLR